MICFCTRINIGILVLLSLGVFQGHGFDAEEHLIFRLYTRSNPIDHQELKTSDSPPISATAFDSRRPTRIFIHGYKSKEKVIIRYKDAFLKLGDFNFIGVGNDYLVSLKYGIKFIDFFSRNFICNNLF